MALPQEHLKAKALSWFSIPRSSKAATHGIEDNPDCPFGASAIKPAPSWNPSPICHRVRASTHGRQNPGMVLRVARLAAVGIAGPKRTSALCCLPRTAQYRGRCASRAGCTPGSFPALFRVKVEARAEEANGIVRRARHSTATREAACNCIGKRPAGAGLFYH